MTLLLIVTTLPPIVRVPPVATAVVSLSLWELFDAGPVREYRRTVDFNVSCRVGQ